MKGLNVWTLSGVANVVILFGWAYGNISPNSLAIALASDALSFFLLGLAVMGEDK